MSEPPIRQAINLTLDTITRRTRGYRNLVVILSIVGVTSLLSALIWWQWQLLVSLAMILPIVSGWMFLDARLLRQWCHEVVRICREGTLDVEVFAGTITLMKHLPQQTIGSMISHLREHCSHSGHVCTTSEDPGDLNGSQSELKTYFVIALLSLIACVIVVASLWKGLLIGEISGSLLWIISLFVPRWFAREPVRLQTKAISSAGNLADAPNSTTPRRW